MALFFSFNALGSPEPRAPSAPNGAVMAVIGAAGPPSRRRLQWESAAGPIHPAHPPSQFSALGSAVSADWRVAGGPPRAGGGARGPERGCEAAQRPFRRRECPPSPAPPRPPAPGRTHVGGGTMGRIFSLGPPFQGACRAGFLLEFLLENRAISRPRSLSSKCEKAIQRLRFGRKINRRRALEA